MRLPRCFPIQPILTVMQRPVVDVIKKMPGRGLFRRFFRFRSSIYGWVVLIIAGSLIILFVLFNLVFRSIYTDFYNRTLSQSGDRISSIIEGSLYYSMLANDKGMLQRTLDIISSMSGIYEVNRYDDQEQLAN